MKVKRLEHPDRLQKIIIALTYVLNSFKGDEIRESFRNAFSLTGQRCLR